MSGAGWMIFLGAVFAGSYVQSVSGFAMGLIVIAVVGASQGWKVADALAEANVAAIVQPTENLPGGLDRRDPSFRH